MSEAFRLARRDLRGGLGGLGLLWLCLAIAVAAIASVTSLNSSIDSAIAGNGRDMIGGDLVVRSAQREASADELAVLRTLGRVSASITARSMVIGPKGDVALAELSSIDDAWPLAGALALASGGERPHGRSAVIGRELADKLGVARGAQSLRNRGFSIQGSGLILHAFRRARRGVAAGVGREPYSASRMIATHSATLWR